MSDVAELEEHLRGHLRLCEDVLTMVERENASLKQAESGLDAKARTELLPQLEGSLSRLKEWRARWAKIPLETRRDYPEIAGLLRQNQDVIMRIIVLDRENEQTLLRKGMVPTKHLPPANRNRPHYVADLYRRGGSKA
jgi:hypothetical protein